MIASSPVTPSPASTVAPASTVNGGHVAAQSSVQVLVPSVSWVKTYSVWPSGPTSEGPASVSATSTVIVAASSEDDSPAPPPEAEHAANSMRATARVRVLVTVRIGSAVLECWMDRHCLRGG